MTFNPAAPDSRASIAIAGANSLNAIACSSAARCVTVYSVGNEFLGTAAGTLPCPTRAQIRGLMREQLEQSVKRAKIGELLRHGGYPIAFLAPASGRLKVSWYLMRTGAQRARRHHKATLIATGRLSFSMAGTGKLEIVLTVAGKRLLRHATRLELTAQATFTPRGQKAVIATRKLALRR